MHNNKRGVGMNAFLWVFVFAVVALIGVVLWTTQSDQAIQQEVAVTEQTISSIKEGDTASLRINAYDKTNNNAGTLLATPVYCTKNGGLVADGTSLSTTARTTVSVNTGDTVQCITFNGTGVRGGFYGLDWKSTAIPTEIVDLDLDAYKVADSVQIKLYSTSGIVVNEGTAINTVNITLGVSQTDTLNSLRLKTNESDRAFNFKGFYFDTVVGTNVSNIEVGSGGNGLQKGNYIIDYSKDQADFILDVATPILLEEFDEVDFGSIKFTADGDGCPDNVLGDLIYIYPYDSAPFRSQKEQTIKFGYQNDADSPTDVGAPTDADGTFIARLGFYCN